MHIKAPALSIPEDDPFKHDALRRKESVEILTQFTSTLRQPYVLAIDSGWGTGKTVFLTMWAKYLKAKDRPSLYFNAWENDFAADPLIALIGEVGAQMEQLTVNSSDKPKAQAAFQKAKKAGGALLKKSLPFVVKTATAGLVDVEGLDEWLETIAEERIKKYEEDRKSISEFKQQLETFVTAVQDEKKQPVIFFIDELDRCRPPYAIEVLERVKHLFSVPGLVFVLGLDKPQLGHSVRSVYGQNFDANGYLRRFIDLDYNLPQPEPERFFYSLWNRHQLEPFVREHCINYNGDPGQYLKAFSAIADVLGLSLRVREQVFSHWVIALRLIVNVAPNLSMVLAFLVSLRAANPELFRNYLKKSADGEAVLGFLKEQPNGGKFLRSGVGFYLAEFVKIAFMDSAAYSNYCDTLVATQQNQSESREQRQLASQQSQAVGTMTPYRDDIDGLVKILEIGVQFGGEE